MPYARSLQVLIAACLASASPIALAETPADPAPAPSQSEEASGPRLGIQGESLTPEQADARGTITRRGVIVGKVLAGSAAARAGLAAGDVLIAIDQAPIGDTSDLAWEVGQLEPGQKVALQFVRNGVTTVRIATLERAAAQKP